MTNAQIKLGDIAVLEYGKSLPSHERIKGNYSVYGSGGIVGTHKVPYINNKGIIVGRKGSIGKVYYSATPFFPIDTVFYIDSLNENYDLKFYYYFLSNIGLEKLNSDAAVPGLNRNWVHSLKAIIPPLPTQQKIAAILSAYDDLIENNNKRISILENMAEQIYKEWFVRMRFPNYKNTKFVKGIPDGWEVTPISSIYLTSSGGTPTRGINKYYEGNIPWIKTGELRDTFIRSTAENITQEGLNNSSAKLFPKHSVILALYGATIGQVGITTQESATNQACCVLLPKSDYISYEFTFQLIRTLKQYFFLVAFGGAQQNISQDIVKKTKITIPPKQLIIDYINKVKNSYVQIENLHKQQIIIKETRDLLLPRLLSGKLSVENLDIKFPPSMENDNA